MDGLDLDVAPSIRTGPFVGSELIVGDTPEPNVHSFRPAAVALIPIACLDCPVATDSPLRSTNENVGALGKADKEKNHQSDRNIDYHAPQTHDTSHEPC